LLLIEGHFIEDVASPLVELRLSSVSGSKNKEFYAGRLRIAEWSRDTQRTLIDATLTLIMTQSFGLLRVADKISSRTRLFQLQRQTDTLLIFQAAESVEADTVRMMTYSFARQDSALIIFAIEERLCSFDTTACQPPLARYYLLRKQKESN